MRKTVIYRWHLGPDLKRSLEAEARAEKTSIAAILNRVVRECLARREAQDEAEQRHLHAEFLKVVGTIDAGDAEGAGRRERHSGP
jgi:hypothetical protein